MKTNLAIVSLMTAALCGPLTIRVRAARVNDISSGTLSMTEWLPDDLGKSQNKYPLIAFSHGFGGCAKQSKFLMKALADHGYVVVAPNHADARCGGEHKDAEKRPQRSFIKPGEWTQETEKNRAEDIVSSVDFVLNDPATRPFIDKDRIGLAGHSLGGYTVLGLAGAWPQWRDKRFKAVLALSPYADPFIVNGNIRHIGVPVMYQGGTRDFGITPSLKKEGGGAYDQTPSPKYFVDIDKAGHFAFTDLNPRFQGIVVDYSLAFLDKYIMGKDSPLLRQSAGKGVHLFKASP